MAGNVREFWEIFPGVRVFFGGIFPKIPIFPSFSPNSHSSFPLIPTQPRLLIFRASGMRIPLGIGAPGIFLNLFSKENSAKSGKIPREPLRRGRIRTEIPKFGGRRDPKVALEGLGFGIGSGERRNSGIWKVFPRNREKRERQPLIGIN